MAQPQGFWASAQASTHSARSGNGIPIGEHSTEHFDSDPLLDAYKGVVRHIAHIHSGFRTPTGRPKKPPAFIAVSLCAQEGEYGLTDARAPKGRRFACNTCYSFAPTIWAEGVAPPRDEQEQEWADWAAKQTERSESSKVRKRLREMGVIQ